LLFFTLSLVIGPSAVVLRHLLMSRQFTLPRLGQPREVAGVAPRGVTGATASRLRPRSRWVAALQQRFGGRRGIVAEVFRGRWTPDLPSTMDATAVSAMKTLVADGARVLGGGTCPRGGEEGGEEVFLHLELQDGSWLTIFPSLVAELCCFAGFRPRDPVLLMSLRFRALQWVNKVQMRWLDASLGIHGSLVLGAMVSGPEKMASMAARNLAPSLLRPLS